METITVDKKELKKIIDKAVKESVRDNIIDILSNNNSYLKAPVLEAIEEIALANAIDEGMKSETIDLEGFERKLKKRIESL